MTSDTPNPLSPTTLTPDADGDDASVGDAQPGPALGVVVTVGAGADMGQGMGR